MNELIHKIYQNQIARSLTHLQTSPWLLKPTIEFIIWFNHEHNCKRIQLFLEYLRCFVKHCSSFDLLFKNQIEKTFNQVPSLRSNWTKIDETNFKHLKIQTCLIIKTDTSNLKENEIIFSKIYHFLRRNRKVRKTIENLSSSSTHLRSFQQMARNPI